MGWGFLRFSFSVVLLLIPFTGIGIIMKDGIALSLVVASASILCGCATSLFPKDFTPGSGNSLIISADKMPSYGTKAQIVRRIDGDQFEEGSMTFMLYSLSFWKLKEVKEASSGATFSVMSTKTGATIYEPGKYVVIGEATSIRTGDSFSNGTFIVGSGDAGGFKCFQDKAPIYEVKENEIVIIPMVNFEAANLQVLEDFELVRQNYPQIRGKARVAEPSNYITFGEADVLDEQACKEAVEFTYLE